MTLALKRLPNDLSYQMLSLIDLNFKKLIVYIVIQKMVQKEKMYEYIAEKVHIYHDIAT